MEALAKAGPSGMTAAELVDAVYGDCEGGGPDWALTTIYVTAKRLKGARRIEAAPRKTVYRLRERVAV